MKHGRCDIRPTLTLPATDFERLSGELLSIRRYTNVRFTYLLILTHSRYSFHIQIRTGNWVGLSDWLMRRCRDTHLSTNRARWRVTSLLPLDQTQSFGLLYIRWSDVTVICKHNTISMLWGNTAYCIQLSCEDLARYSNKTESLGLRKCPYYHYFIEKVIYLSIYPLGRSPAYSGPIRWGVFIAGPLR